jgi:hypothetical protein
MPDKPTHLSPVQLSRVAFGVRYEPQWRIIDSIGEVIDTVLRTDGTPFGPEVFPTSQSESSGHVLLNGETHNVLRIDQQEVVLEWTFDTRNLDEVSELAAQFQKLVIEPLRDEAGLANIVRYGMLFRPERQTSPKNPPLQKYLSSEFAAASLTSLAMRFTRRIASEEAMWRKGVEDYRNLIYTAEESEKGEVQLTLDYQEIFKPMLDGDDWGKHPFTRFVTQALQYFEQDGAKWLKQFSDSPAAVA